MDKRTFLSSFSFIVFKTLVTVLLFQSALSAPVNSSISYDTFLKNITRDNCAFPSGIVLPFQDSIATFQYFSELLKICKAPEAMKRSLEAITLCNEIYDALRNITCHSDKNIELPEIKINFSDNVCKDVNSLQLQHTLEKKSLLQHLTDKFFCDMMCEDDFLPACKLLLWSFQLLKRIEGIPLVQPIQNSPKQENNAGSGISSVTKSLNPKPEDSAIDKGQESLNPNEVPAVESPDNKMDGDQQTVNDDTDKNELGHVLKSNKDKETIEVENEVQDEPTLKGRKDNELSEKQEQTSKLSEDNELSEKQQQTLKLDERKQTDQMENEALNTNDEAVESKVEKQVSIINNQPSKENKIDVDEGPPKLSEPLNSKTTVFKNNPALPILEVSNKTAPQKDVTTVQNNLLPESPKENLVKVKPAETINDNITSNNLKPVVPVLNKLPTIVSHPSTPSKTSSIGANEAKVSIKPEIPLANDNEVADNKVILPIDKDNAFSVTTVADLEKMEEGNGIPEPADKDPDLYNDMESEGEYSKLEYDEDGIYDSSKNKKQEEPDSGKISKPALAENESPKYDVFPQRNSFGRGSGDILSTFPEQEDSHFFFYFLSLVLILMAGYLLFHNKQKIIALIVEGRHERRRRSHGLGYKKLETK